MVTKYTDKQIQFRAVSDCEANLSNIKLTSKFKSNYVPRPNMHDGNSV